MLSPQIRITKTRELKKMLEILKEQFALLSESEILKLALSDFFRRQEEGRRQRRVASLPFLELSDEEQVELTKGLKELERMKEESTLRPMSVEEIMDEIAS